VSNVIVFIPTRQSRCWGVEDRISTYRRDGGRHTHNATSRSIVQEAEEGAAL
jgi:hypothetical protein